MVEDGDVLRSDVLTKTLRALEKYPLCDRCLGRLFAKLSYGHSNKERGRALKTVLLMELHKRVLEGDAEAREKLVAIAPHIGSVAASLYKRLTGSELPEERCAICGGELDKFIEDVAERSLKLLDAYEISRFVVGVRASRAVLEIEERVKMDVGAEYAESIKAEIRREVGKLIQKMSGKQADFEEPEATVLVDFPGGAVWIQVNSLLIKGRYWKKGRMISQAYWPTPEGPKYYSIEQALWGLLKLTGGERVILHAAGREDVDARMLGTGRPMIVEVKAPRRRSLTLKELEEAANHRRDVVEFKFEGLARRHDIVHYKTEEGRKEKTYKALIVVEGGVTDEEVQLLEETFRRRLILQRTPKRVLHRRPDVLRRRTVLGVKCRKLWGPAIECLIDAEGGLYIKELVSGDDGRTTPSFSEVLGKKAVCVELDVLGVRI